MRLGVDFFSFVLKIGQGLVLRNYPGRIHAEKLSEDSPVA